MTYEEWLESQLNFACEDLSGNIEAEIAQRTIELEEKDAQVTKTLENLFPLLGEADESFDDFSARIRGNFDTDDTAVPVESSIFLPTVPENCNEDTKASLQ